MGDDFIIDENKDVISERIQKLSRGEYSESSLNSEFKLGKNYARFVIDNYKKLQFDDKKLVKIDYRPFDKRWTYFDNKVVWRWRKNVMKHLLKDNLALGYCRQVVSETFSHTFVANNMMDDSFVSNKSRERGYCVPLYLYYEDGTTTPNLKTAIVDEIESIVGRVSPEDVFDYVYTVLHSPNYREKYKEFLKIDFPRVPFPKDTKSFNKLVAFGTELRELHLLESPRVNQFITTYPIDGSNIVEKINYKEGNIYINEDQYFGKVPEVSWNFYIGGYQPAQKWLKDRRGRELTNENIEHYQKMIVALTGTDRIMKEINKILE
jgi:predicted helicase